MMIKVYAGIGARKTPKPVLRVMTKVSRDLEAKGYKLRSGGALGADRAFAKGVRGENNKIIYKAEDCETWCETLIKRYIPKNRPPFSFMNKYVQKLLGRNAKILLGNDEDIPVDFVLCWTPLGVDAGGTGYAIRMAIDYGIPVYNLFEYDTYTKIMSALLKAGYV